MALSNQLKAIADQVRNQSQQQQTVGQAQVGGEAASAMSQTATTAPTGKRQAQALAGGITQAQQNITTQAVGQEQQTLAGLGQQSLQQAGQARQQSLGEQQLINDSQISELQRKGLAQQNSAALEQSKRLQQKELDVQNRLTSARLEYDSSLSFLTSKQREDLAQLGAYTKNVAFDQRLTFEKTETDRRFTNTQQLADYAISSFKSDQQLQTQMKHMEQAAYREITALQSAHNMITSRMEFEFQRAEKTKDYALLKDLQEKKNALDEKIRRKAAKGAMISNVIVGATTIAGGVAGAYFSLGNPYAAAAGAQAGAGVGQAIAGGAKSQGAY